MRIAITRLVGKEKDDAARCKNYGHECYPVSPLRAEIREDLVSFFVRSVEAGEYDCLFFTSALPAKIIAPRLSRWPRVIAIGPRTAMTLGHFGIDAETLPSFYSRDFVPYLGSWIRGKRIGIPRADVPNQNLIDGILAAGGIPAEVRVYTLIPTGVLLDVSSAEAILFTSAMSFSTAVYNADAPVMKIAIGESTGAMMRSRGVIPDVTGDGSLEGTLEELNRFLSARKSRQEKKGDGCPD
ncbi:MAG: uroporphyrinogen-III synthase [Methanolinea sp.]|nr:uroporphyrinogen-III synthase [Methanolinea sp.]